MKTKKYKFTYPTTFFHTAQFKPNTFSYENKKKIYILRLKLEFYIQVITKMKNKNEIVLKNRVFLSNL